MRAECQCGRLHIELPGPATAVVACHCVACQRRSGSPFGVLAQYSADQVSVEGVASSYERLTDEGNTFVTFSCPHCGSTVYVKAGKHPTLILVAVGAIADPSFQAPVRSVWEEAMHHWVRIPGDVQHFPKGRG